jgi:hypothetical protein
MTTATEPEVKATLTADQIAEEDAGFDSVTPQPTGDSTPVVEEAESASTLTESPSGTPDQEIEFKAARISESAQERHRDQ